MKPEEKQAIIDKAKELGFVKHYRVADFLWCEVESRFFYLFLEEMMFGEFVGMYQDDRIVTSPQDLETIFNAIVS